MRRRDVLRWLAAAAPLGTSGCTSEPSELADRTPDSGPDSTDGGRTSCDEYVYRSTTANEDAALPWELHIRNVGLSVYPVNIEVTDVSSGGSETVVSCSATADRHSRLVFDLPPEAEYRVRATLNRPENPEQAATTVSGAQLGRTNAALEVTVDRAEGFTIRQIHTDSGVADASAP